MSNWLDRAKCVGMDPALFDVPSGYSRTLGNKRLNDVIDRVAEGKVCDGCPVVRECAQDVLDCKRVTLSVIRGGIPLSDERSGAVKGTYTLPYRALEFVAGGVSPLAARAALVDMVFKKRYGARDE